MPNQVYWIDDDDLVLVDDDGLAITLESPDVAFSLTGDHDGLGGLTAEHWTLSFPNPSAGAIMSREFYTGDDQRIAVTLTTDGSAVAIDPSATVTAGIVTPSGRLLAGPWTLSSATSGSDWSQGVVVASVVGSATIALSAQPVKIEIQVSHGGQKITRRTRTIAMKKGALP